jgi:hypothetical protein|tara:strand:- start:460 stop:1551 length:1092 start_codon:yes stop_codon:yes gene_type:complete
MKNKQLRKLRRSIGEYKLLIRSLLIIFFIHFIPEKAYLFSNRKRLPSKKNKFYLNQKKDNPFEIIHEKTTLKEKWEEINIVARGKSFNLDKIKNFEAPTFLVGFWSPLELNVEERIEYNFVHDSDFVEKKQQNYKLLKETYGREIGNEEFRRLSREYRFNLDKKKKYQNIFKKKNLYYEISQPERIKKFIENGCNVITVEVFASKSDGSILPLANPDKNNPKEVDPSFDDLCIKNNIPRISVVDLIYKPPRPEKSPLIAPHNSTLCCLGGLAHFSKKINVYGWDYYLSKSPNEMSYWDLLKSFFKKDFIILRDTGYVDSCIVNYYFAYHFSNLHKFKIKSFLGDLKKHKKLMDKLERVLFIKD